MKLYVYIYYRKDRTCSRQGQAQEVVLCTLVYGFGTSFFDNVLLEHGGLPRVLPLAVPIAHSKSLLLFEFF